MAGRLFGVAGTGNSSPPAVAGFKVQTSVYGLPIPIVYGQARVAGNLIQMYQFPPIEQRSQGHSSKLVKVDSQVTGYLYKGAVALALAEGPIVGIGKVWRDKDAADTWANYQTKFGWSLFLGTSSQAPWAWLTSNHPADAVPYQLTAYVANPSLELPNDILANYTWEVQGLAQYGSGVVDANPKDVVTDVLTNADHGVGFPSAQLGDLSAYSNYCIAAGLFLSPVLNGQSPLTDQLQVLADATNSAFVWSDGKLKLVPYADQAITGHAVTYTPNVTPLYDLTDDDYIAPEGTDPVVITRKKPAECFNQITVEYEDRAHDYNPNVQEAKDQASIDAYGLRPAPALRFAAIKDADTARFIAQLRLQRELSVRNTYQFTLGMKYTLLEPMDLVTLTDSGLGLDHVAVRLTSIEEDEQGDLVCTAEDFPAGIATASRYGSAGANGYAPATNAPPGSTVAPAIFEGPGPLASSALEIWIAASGGANWGGCDVWLSTDNVNFTRVASITRKATYGVLTAALASAAASPPNDATHTLAVDVSSSAGALAAGSASDLAALLTLCLVENEFLAYQGAALSSAYQYNLTTLARGLYGSTIPSSHAIGAPFVRCDDALLRLPFPQGTNGQVVYFKFPAFNTFGQALEDVATVASYTHTIGKNTVTTGGAGIVGAPTASLDFVSEDDFQVTLALNGFLGSGAWGSLQYSTRVGSGAWSAWSTSHANWSVPRAPKLTKSAQLQVLQADGQISQVAIYPVTGVLGAVNSGTGQIDNSAPIGPRNARDVAHQVGRYFTETWEQAPSTHWELVNGTANATTVGVNGVGGAAAAFTGGQQWRYAGRLPFNSTKLYRFRAIIAMANGGTPIGTTYIGVECFDGTGASLGVAWMVANNLLLPDFAQHTFTGWFKDTVGYTGLEAHDPSAPGGLIANTAYIAPRFAFNQGNTDGLSQVYCYALQIDEVDEDASGRIYGGMDAGSNLLGTVQQYDNPSAPTLNKKPIKGYQSGICYNGQAITFPVAFQNPPAMRFSRGNNTVTSQPNAAKWVGGTFNSGQAQIEDVRAAGLSPTGFTCVAQLVQTGSGSSQNSEFPTSNSLTGAGQATQLALANVPSSNGHYTVRYKVSIDVAAVRSRTASVVVVVNRRAGGSGGAITELRRDTYSCTDATGAGATYDSGVLIYDFNGTLAAGDYLEVKIDSVTSSGTGSTTVTVHGCNQTDDPGYDGESHTYGAATITSSMTQDTTHDSVIWEAWSWQ